MKVWKLSILALVAGCLMLAEPHAIAKGGEQHPVIQKASESGLWPRHQTSVASPK